MTAGDFLIKETSPWFAAFITELLVIVIINILTLMAFARIRHLRKSSTYLIINLAVADLLVGALTVPLYMFQDAEQLDEYTWSLFIKCIPMLSFPLASQVNLSLISLERLHATLFPFRHCLIIKYVYYKIIICSWFITLVMAFLIGYSYLMHYEAGFSYAWASFSLLTLLVLTVSYVIIIVNVQSSRHLPPHGLIPTERKLTVTLFITTGVSVLTILPVGLYNSTPAAMRTKLCNASCPEINVLAHMIYFSSSIVHPLVYAIRLQEFRNAIGNIVTRQSGAEHRI